VLLFQFSDQKKKSFLINLDQVATHYYKFFFLHSCTWHLIRSSFIHTFTFWSATHPEPRHSGQVIITIIIIIIERKYNLRSSPQLFNNFLKKLKSNWDTLAPSLTNRRANQSQTAFGFATAPSSFPAAVKIQLNVIQICQ
jgi:hypothetical protein